MTRTIALLVFVISCCSGSAFSQNYARYSNITAGMKNGYLEQQALRAANRRGSDIRCKEDFTQAKIVSEDWEIERDHTGTVSGRHLHMELYGESNDGKCGVSHCVFRQKVQGDDTFSPKLRLVEMGPFYTLQCE